MSNIKYAVPPVAAFALYRAYQSGALGQIKDKIFGEQHSATPLEMPPAGFDDTIPDTLDSGETIPIEPADTIHGQPAENVVFDPNVYQYYEDTCAIQSQHLILQQFGVDVTQEEMIAVAKENGWYAEGYGTPMNMVGKLLEYYGVDVNGSMGNNIFNLSNELAQGHQIIVGVDAYELLYPNETAGMGLVYGEAANHALVVAGIDTSDPNNIQVIVTDPGTGNRQMAYPADQFIEAWKDSDCFMVSTNEVPTANPMYPYTPIDNFAGIPLETLDRLSDMDINMDNKALYDDFVDDFFDNPQDFDDLICQYEDLFTPDLDEMNE